MYFGMKWGNQRFNISGIPFINFINMDAYTHKALHELSAWQYKMMRKPSMFDRFTSRMQEKMNNIIPEKVHIAITAAIKQMTRVVLFGAGLTTGRARTDGSLQ